MSPEDLKRVQTHQSPINVKEAEAEYTGDIKLDIKYSPVAVSADRKHPGQLILDVANLGEIHVQTPGYKKPLKYKATEVHFNGPSEHKLDGNRTDVEMQILHEIEQGYIPEGDHETPHFAIIGVLYKKDN